MIRVVSGGSVTLRRGGIVALAAACVATAVGCGGGSNSAAEEQALENRRIVRELFAALSRADVEAVDALYAEDFTLWTAGSLPISGRHGRAEALESMRQISAAFPDGLRFGVDALTVEGERVAVEAHSEGTHANGEVYGNQYHFLVVIRNGRIVELKEYMDTAHAEAVLVGSGDAAQ